MREIGEMILCVFAVFGVYALFCRLVVWLLPPSRTALGVRLSGAEDEGTVRACVALAQRKAESDASLSPRVVVLLSGIPDEGTIRFLEEENVEIYCGIPREGGTGDGNGNASRHG